MVLVVLVSSHPAGTDHCRWTPHWRTLAQLRRAQATQGNTSAMLVSTFWPILVVYLLVLENELRNFDFSWLIALVEEDDEWLSS